MKYVVFAVLYAIGLVNVWLFVAGAKKIRNTPEEQIADDDERGEWVQMVNRK